MPVTNWDACRSGAGITVTLDPEIPGLQRKMFVKKIECRDGKTVIIGGDGNRIPLS